MAKFHPYLYFNGNTEEAFHFYKSIFDGDFEGGVMRYKDMPAANEEANMTEEEANKVMHVALPIGDGYYLMGTDRIKPHGADVVEGTNMNICIGPDNEEQARTWFAALAVGGTIHTQLDHMPWGALYGDLTDRFGIQWMINFENR
jgi:PhnB protein